MSPASERSQHDRQRPGASAFTEPRRTFRIVSDAPLVIEVEHWNPFWNRLGLWLTGLALLPLAVFAYAHVDAWRKDLLPLASVDDLLWFSVPLAVMALGVWLLRRRVAPEVIETVTVDAEWLTIERLNRQRVRVPRRAISDVQSLWGPLPSRCVARVVHARGAVDVGALRLRSLYVVDSAPDRFVTVLERALAPEAEHAGVL